MVRDNWCRDFETDTRSVANQYEDIHWTSSFLDHEQTPEGKNVVAFYVCCQMPECDIFTMGRIF